MPDTSLVQALLSLFTTPGRAESIAGDLTEERELRGSRWFWFHAVRTTLALFTNGFAAAPITTIALTVFGFALFVMLGFGGVAAIFLFPVIGSAPSWALISLFWWTAAFGTGAALVGVAPKHGMKACLSLALACEALLLLAPLFSPAEPRKTWSVLVYASALFASAPLLAGGATVRWRTASRSMATFLLLLLLGILASPRAIAAQQPAEWRDPSPHRSTLVSVDEGVQLEVLDWGGTGLPVVLLAGLGDTAHVYDAFAPMLARDYRVYGITRRGHPHSSAPLTGYEFARLAEDVARVVRTLALAKPIVVGHSIAGEELHVFGSRYAAEVAGLVYLDAAFNRSAASKDYDAVARKLPPEPAPEPKDLSSVAALRAFRMKIEGAALPEAHLRARYVIHEDGTVGGAWLPPLPIRQAFTAEIHRINQQYNPEPIRVPALAIYAVPKSPADLMQPWYKAGDPAVRENLETLHRLARERFHRHAQWFESFAEQGRVSEIAGAHHLFLTNAGEVLSQIRSFVSSLPSR